MRKMQFTTTSFLGLPRSTENMSKCIVERTIGVNQFSIFLHISLALGHSYSKWLMDSGMLHSSQFSLSLKPKVHSFLFVISER